MSEPRVCRSARGPRPGVVILVLLAFALAWVGVPATSSAFHDIVCFNGCDTDDDGDGWTEAQGDCFDSSVDANAFFVHPNQPDSCDFPGPVDSNCNRCVGDGCARSEPPFDTIDCDGDGDGVRASEGDCDDGEATIYPGATENCTNGIDDNCDRLVDADDPICTVDADGDGYTVGEGDCDDQNGDVHPGVVEACNFRDDNCDQVSDEQVFALGTACANGSIDGTYTCTEGGEGVICQSLGGQLFATGDPVTVYLFGASPLFDSDIYLFSPGPPRLLGNVRENSSVELGSYPAGTEMLFGIVTHNTFSNVDDKFVMGPACRNFDGGVHATILELLAQGPSGWLVAFEDLRAPSPPDFHDGLFGVFGVTASPGALDVPERCNGIDDDCSGQADDGLVDVALSCDTGLFGVCASGTTACDAGALSCTFDQGPTSEICNGQDDDCDGVTDEDDVCGPPVVHDLAVAKVAAPGIVTIKNGKAVTKVVTVTVQNRSAHPETIDDAAELQSLVGLTIPPVSPGCSAAPTVALHPVKKFPITLKPKQKLAVKFDVEFAQACDPAKSTKSVDHDDFRYGATITHAVLGGADAHPADDVCPRAALGVDPNPDGKVKDAGCGEVRTDVVVK